MAESRSDTIIFVIVTVHVNNVKRDEGICKVALEAPARVSVGADPADADFILEFATTQAEVEKRLAALHPHDGQKTLAWPVYPKGSKAAGYDLSRDTVWKFAQTIGLALVANVSIDGLQAHLRHLLNALDGSYLSCTKRPALLGRCEPRRLLKNHSRALLPEPAVLSSRSVDV